MRLLQINKYTTLNGGSEVVLDTVRRLGKLAGNEVWNIGFAKPGQKHIEDSSDLGTEALHLTDMFWNKHLVQQVIDTAREFRPDAILHHNVYHHFPMTQLVKALDRHVGAPQSIILHDLKPVCPTYLGMREGAACTACSGGAFWKAVLHRCKNRSYVHSSLVAMDSYWNASIGKVYDRFHNVLSPSTFLQRTVQSMGIGRAVRILPNPCPPTQRGGDSRAGIVFAGRLSTEKGVLPLLDAAKSASDIPIRLIGDGPLLDIVRQRASSLPNVTVLGRLSRDQVREHMATARFTILPSVCQENNPMVGLESLANGTPLLGSNMGGIPELAEGNRGVLFDPNLTESIVAALRFSQAMSSSQWNTMSDASRSWADANSESTYFNRLLALIS